MPQMHFKISSDSKIFKKKYNMNEQIKEYVIYFTSSVLQISFTWLQVDINYDSTFVLKMHNKNDTLACKGWKNGKNKE